MCGFVGYKITEKRDSDGKIIKEMADTIVHRGPDDEGYYVDEGVALGFRRLSIIDLASGAQPMQNEDGTKVLVFNGEVYNFREIREKLVAAGEALLAAIEAMMLAYRKVNFKAAMLNAWRDAAAVDEANG